MSMRLFFSFPETIKKDGGKDREKKQSLQARHEKAERAISRKEDKQKEKEQKRTRLP